MTYFTETETDILRSCMRPEYRNLSNESINELLNAMYEGAVGQEGFLDNLKGVVAKAAPVVGQIGGTALGAYLGGPAGMAIGSSLGGSLGQMAGQFAQGKKPVATSISGKQQAIPQNVPLMAQPSTSPQLNDLMSLLNNQGFLQSIISQGLGGLGNNTVAVPTPQGDKTVPNSAFLNAMGVVTNQIQKQMTPDVQQIPTYLQNAQGEFVCDLGSDIERAEALISMLKESTYVKNGSVSIYEWFENAGFEITESYE